MCNVADCLCCHLQMSQSFIASLPLITSTFFLPSCCKIDGSISIWYLIATWLVNCWFALIEGLGLVYFDVSVLMGFSRVVMFHWLVLLQQQKRYKTDKNISASQTFIYSTDNNFDLYSKLSSKKQKSENDCTCTQRCQFHFQLNKATVHCFYISYSVITTNTTIIQSI